MTAGSRAEFHNQVDFCIGTGRMGLALHREYYEQLKLVQDAIGFQHIRGHGLFCDDMAIYQETEWDGVRTVEYNFTYLDRVMDDYRSLGLKPFLELGFMPEKMASGTQTIFYWKGNTTPPRSYEDWKAMVQALLRHLIDRYGEEAYTYPIEVWNEPNLPGFWYKADMQEYFKLFRESFEAVKAVDPRFRVGGPAVCGGTDEIWIGAFMEFCHENRIPLDFVTRHHYTSEFPDRDGHYGYIELMDEEDGFANLHTTREIIDKYPEYRGLPIHITEFNTSYIPNAPIHDTNQNAAYIAKQLSRLGDDNESYSYWTFGDVFEEQGVPFTPFHGGFGLVANGCIPKPTFWSFVFFKNLKRGQGECVYKNDNCVIMKMADGEYRGVAWNAVRKRAGNDLELEFSLEQAPGNYCLLTKRVDEECCNPLKVWHDLGEPANPSEEQNALLRAAAQPKIATRRLTAESGGCGSASSGRGSDCTESMKERAAAGEALEKPAAGIACVEMENKSSGVLKFSLTLPENALVYFEVRKADLTPDRGYHYEKVNQQGGINPLIGMDYPDPDVIRVGDVYYMASTTMYYMPGCEILRSYDLMHWEHAAFVYDRLDSTPAQRMEGGENIYGQGMWAASLRYHQGMFYVVFIANDTHKTYLYRAKDVQGPWEKSEIQGFYHDSSLLFDDDGRVYIVYGNKEIHLTELKEDLTGPKEGGLDRVILTDSDDVYLGYEGSHFYKINGKYYLFLIHMPKSTGRRTEACFMAESLEGEFTGGDICDDDRGYCGSGVAQGGVVDTPSGKWYAILFQDTGAVGRIPALIPVRWEGDRPVLGINGKIPEVFPIEDNRPGYRYAPLFGSDDFKDGADTKAGQGSEFTTAAAAETCSGQKSGGKTAGAETGVVQEPGGKAADAETAQEKTAQGPSFGFKSFWQFSHEPDLRLVERDGRAGTVRITTDKLCKNLVQAKNILTQRTLYPGCRGTVTVDGSGLKEGDFAGLCFLESQYAYLAVTRREGALWLVMRRRVLETDSFWGERRDQDPGQELAVVKLSGEKVKLRGEADFYYQKDTAGLYYSEGETGEFLPLGPKVKLCFKLDHFTGVRFGLFVFSTKETGGNAVFSDFRYDKKLDGVWEVCR